MENGTTAGERRKSSMIQTVAAFAWAEATAMMPDWSRLHATLRNTNPVSLRARRK
jgi:hypothetical protein